MCKPGAVIQTAASSSGCGYGKGFRRIPLTTLKIAVFAPIPTANVRRATAVNRGARPRLRRTCQSWTLTHAIGSPPHVMYLPEDPNRYGARIPRPLLRQPGCWSSRNVRDATGLSLVTIIGACLTYSYTAYSITHFGIIFGGYPLQEAQNNERSRVRVRGGPTGSRVTR